MKWLHREIMLSATYQQASAFDEVKYVADPDNRLLWRVSRRRLDVEAWRDAMLAVSGTLDLAGGGRSIDLSDTANRRRTIYGTVRRRDLNDMLRLYDFPDPEAHSCQREPTTTPLQQLFVLNSPFIEQQAKALAERLRSESPGGVEDQVRRAYRLLFARDATDADVRRAMEFFAALGPGNVAADAMQRYAQVLLGSNEFMFVD